jgi:hypothetical protein
MARLHQIVVDCWHPAALARFWSAALDGFEVLPYDDEEIARLAALGLTPETDTCVIVAGSGLELCFQQVDLAHIAKNPVHVDVSTPNREREVNRLVELGATVAERFADHTWMHDPEGNDFCVTDERERS